jgi:hypothetical protein
VRPSWHYVYLFIGSYMAGQTTEAVGYANAIPNDNTALGLVAQVLAAHASGKEDDVKKAADRLRAIGPGWVKNPHQELSRIIAAPAVVDRLAKGLAAAGVTGGS